MSALINQIQVITGNPKKTEDFKAMGFKIITSDLDLPEVDSQHIQTVAVHKCLDLTNALGLSLALVEDTALHVKGIEEYGTHIKHIYSQLEKSEDLNGVDASWQVALGLRINDEIWVSTGTLPGKLKYPKAPTGYHFDQIFSLDPQWIKDLEGVSSNPLTIDPWYLHKQLETDMKKYIHFENLTDEQKQLFGPRFLALRKLTRALSRYETGQVLSNDGIYRVKIKDIQPWMGPYQVENSQKATPKRIKAKC